MGDEIPTLAIGDTIETPYGRMEITDIERHDFDHPRAHLDAVVVDSTEDSNE